MDRLIKYFLVVWVLMPTLSLAQLDIIGPATVCPNVELYYSFDLAQGCPLPDGLTPYYGWTTNVGYFTDGMGNNLGTYIETFAPATYVMWVGSIPTYTNLHVEVFYIDQMNVHYTAGCGGDLSVSYLVPDGTYARQATGILLSDNTFCPGSTITMTAFDGSGTLSQSTDQYIWTIMSSAGTYSNQFTNTSNPFSFTIPSSAQPNENFNFNVFTENITCNSIFSTPIAVDGTVIPPSPTATITVKNKTCSDPSSSGLQISNFSNPYYSSVMFSFAGQIPVGYSQSNIVMSNATAQNVFFNFPAGASYSVQIQGYDPAHPNATVCPNTLGSFGIGTIPDDASVSGSVTTNYNGSQVSCYGSSDAQIQVSGSGSATPLQFQLNSSGYQSSTSFGTLGVGSYTPYVKDNNGCVHSAVAISVSGPSAAVSVSPSITHPTCSGSQSTGSVSLSPSGGTGPYTYYLDGASQGGSSFSATPGGHTVKISDANSCYSSDNPITINQPITASYSSSAASCSTVSDGSITVNSAAGGTGSFQYSLNGGGYQGGVTFSGISSGTYSINVKDGNNCVYTINNASVGLQPPISGSITQTSPIKCYGQTTAAFNVVASGGTAPYTTYSWSNGATGSSVSNVGVGSYTVTITDTKGCQGTASISISQPSQLVSGLSTSNHNGFNISCKGGSDGTIDLTPSNGTGPYTYLWSTGSTAQNLSGLSAGNYSVTISDNNNCTIPKSVSLTEPLSAVTVALKSKTDVSCYGGNNGSITVTRHGGVGAIAFSKDNWGTSQLDSVFSALPVANYTIYARDANGCNASVSPIAISSPTALVIGSINLASPSCNGGNGTITVNATGGTGTYSYSNGGSFNPSNNPFTLPAGFYVLSVQDGNGCTVSSSSQQLTEPTALNLSSSSTPQSCPTVVDGTITLNGTGGTPPYAFSKDGGSTFPPGVNVFTGLAANTYTTAIKDNHGCTTTKPVAVAIKPTLSGSISETSRISCYGQSTAALSVSTAGGTSPYSYVWSNGATGQNINSLAANSYSVVITDSKNCTTSQSIVVQQPTLLTVSATNSDYNGYGVSCTNSTDGFINATGNNGTSPYTYAWSNGATSPSISAIASGSYTVTVTDSKNCTANLPVTLSAPTLLSLATSSITNETCNGGNNGAVTVSSSGGAGNYFYSINNGTSWQPSPTFSSLVANPYTVQIKDANNCSNSVSVNITQPTAVTIAIGAIQDAACGTSNGSIQSSASGGTGALSYVWQDASNQNVGTSANLVNFPSGIYTLTVTDQSACTATTSANISSPNGPGFSVVNQVAASCSYSADGHAAVSITSGPSPYTVNWGNGETGSSAIHLSAGSGTVTVIDANNCSTIQNFTTASPVAISLSSSLSTQPTCPKGNDGSIQITATGGNAPYTYAWNGNTGNNLLTGVSAGTYSLAVVDANNCIYSQDIDVIDVAPIVVNVLNQVLPTCTSSADGSLFVQASGGNGSFTYSWNTSTTGAQLNSIAAGDYTVTAIDSKNCPQQKLISLAAPAPILESLTATATLCNGGNSGTITSAPTGGTGAYSFSRDNGNTWQSPNVFAGLSAGNYTILAKDVNGCSTLSSTTVTEPAAIAITISKSDPTCGQANGSAQAAVAGGTGAYSYQWQDGLNQVVGSGSSITNIASDTYTITVGDANLCSSTATISLAQYPSAQFAISNVGPTVCSYSADGSATLQVTSVQSPYSISWSSGETLPTAFKLSAGPNTVTLTDVNNCKFIKTFSVPSPLPISIISETLINPVCTGSGGSIQVTATGGAGNFVYAWNGSKGQNYIQNAKAGSYKLTIADGNGCGFLNSYTLVDPPPFIINLGPDQTICPNTTTSIGLTLPNATYVWTGPNNFASTQGIVTVSTAGQYQLNVTNSNGCKGTDNIVVTISNNLLKADFLSVSNAHLGDTLALIDISWPVPDQIKWEMSDSVTVLHSDNDYALITFSQSGTYTVGVVATLGGCQNEYFQTITVDNLPRGGDAKRTLDDGGVSSLSAYPNPFVGKTNASIELSDEGNATVKVYSLVTNTLIASHEFSGDKVYNVEIDLAGREAGLYIIVVESKSKTKAVRVIKL